MNVVVATCSYLINYLKGKQAKYNHIISAYKNNIIIIFISNISDRTISMCAWVARRVNII